MLIQIFIYLTTISRFLSFLYLIILLATKTYNKKIQKVKSIFENNYINSTNFYFNLYYIAKAKKLYNLQDLIIN